MSADDCIWYGRVGVWAGAAVLFLMAILGRNLTALAVLSVLGIIVGLVLLIYGLWSRARPAIEPVDTPAIEETQSHA